MYKDQTTNIAKLLKLPSTIFDYSKGLYFARGHLAPNADFITNDEQKATYKLINAVPQWQCINQANWKSLEDNIRTYSANKILDVYTGTFGTLKMKDSEGVEQKIYLGLEERLRAPLFIYKIVIDGLSRSGAVFISVNSPHLEKEDKRKYTYCTDQSSLSTWCVWFKRDSNRRLTTIREDWASSDALRKGYIYACTIEDFIASFNAKKADNDGEVLHHLVTELVTNIIEHKFLRNN